MTQLGDSTKPGNSYFAYDGSGYPNQNAEKLTAPQKIKINTLGAWVGGWNGTCRCILAVWALDGTLLGASAEFTAANEGAAANGNVSQYEKALASPVIIASGVDFYVGVARNRNDPFQFSNGSTVNPHFEATGAYPAGALGSVSGPTSVARRTGMYVADYSPVSAGWVFRGGVWVQAQSVQVRRGGAWVDADSIQVRRGSAWADAG